VTVKRRPGPKTRPRSPDLKEPTTFELIINLKTAKALGFAIPRSVVLRADQVIQ
jgi:putative ABC transport system substrate-binding protein